MRNTFTYEELLGFIENRDFLPVKNWLENGGDPEFGVADGKTSLATQVIYELFEEGDQQEVTALLELFLQRGASVNPGSAHKPGAMLFESLASGNRNAVKLMVHYNADCNVIDESDYPRQTPLIAAVEKNDPKLVEILLPHTSPELIHFVGGYLVCSALGCAFWNGNGEIIRLLLQAGANPWFKEWDHGNSYSKDLIPPEGRTFEESALLEELVNQYSRYFRDETLND